MKLPTLKKLPVANQRVILRTNYDVPLRDDGRVADETRIEESLPTINYLLLKKAKIIIITHLDRPGGKPVPGLSLKLVRERLKIMLPKVKIYFSGKVLGEKTKRLQTNLKPGQVLLLENLRFDPGEEANDQKFGQDLASLADFYINDAFANSHRKHASMVTLPSLLPSGLGFDCQKEVETLTKLRNQPKRPVVVILGGVKESKIKAARKLTAWADSILVGGQLTKFKGLPKLLGHQKIMGSLTKSGEDITLKTAEKFKKVIGKAKTIIWSGPLGAYEEKKYERGTKMIAKAMAESSAFKVVGGGDTEAALTKFGLVEKIDYISSGGGAMLEFLAEGTLPGMEALKGGKND